MKRSIEIKVIKMEKEKEKKKREGVKDEKWRCLNNRIKWKGIKMGNRDKKRNIKLDQCVLLCLSQIIKRVDNLSFPCIHNNTK